MSYNDPYYSSQNNTRYQGPYKDTPDYDPYNTRHQRHPTYDGSGFPDDEPTLETTPVQNSKERAEYDKSGFATTALPVPEKSRSGLRSWRRDHHGNLWTKGGRGRCVGRFCCCTLLIALFLFLSILFTLGIYVRPPNVQINNVGFLATTGSAFQVTSTSFNINLGVNISVDNPNYFAVKFSRITADLTYPVNNMDVGGGEKRDIVFSSNSQTTFDFPFTVSYNITEDPNRVVLTDLLGKCGIGGQKRNVVVKYRITLGIQVVFVTIPPSFSNEFSFECPFTQSDLEELLRGSGVSIPGITG